MTLPTTKLAPILLSMVALGLAPGAASANDFPTTARVEFVLECMQQHNRDYEYFYKCSCVVDEIAKHVNYNEFNEISTASRYAHLGGERGGVFRDPKEVKRMSKKYKTLQADAGKACFVKPPADDD